MIPVRDPGQEEELSKLAQKVIKPTDNFLGKNWAKW